MTNIHEDGYVLLHNILLKHEIELLLSSTHEDGKINYHIVYQKQL